MEIPKAYKALLKPLFMGVGCLVIVSLLYVAGYIFVDYRLYLRNHQIDQRGELAALQQSIQDQTDKFKQILTLTATRVKLAQGNSTRIQSILNSAFRLYEPHELPKVHGFSYSKLSRPCLLITRLDASPLKDRPLVPENTVSTQPTITFHNNTLEGKIFLVGDQEDVEGILKVEVLVSDLKPLLGSFRTLAFSDSDFSKYLTSQEDSLVIGPPSSLWEFAHHSKNHYAIFFLYCLLLFPILLGTPVYLYYQVKDRFREILDSLRVRLKDSQTAETASYERAVLSEKKHKVQQISSQAYRKFQGTLKERFQEHTLQAYNNLTTLR